MRKVLEKFRNNDSEFEGVFKEYGSHIHDHIIYRTVLIENITDMRGNHICTHLWFNEPATFNRLNLKSGDVIRFRAKSAKYWRKDGSTDYHLKTPIKVTRIGNLSFS